MSKYIISATRTFTVIIMVLGTLAIAGCSKSSSPGTFNQVPSNAALLVKQVDISRNAQNVIIDSVTTLFEYDNNKNVTQVQRSEGYLISGSSESSSQTWTFTYAGGLISSSTEMFSSQSSIQGGGSSVSSGQTTIRFYANNARIAYYTGVTTDASTAFGITVNSTKLDSAVFTYNGNNISNYSLYEEASGASVYSQVYNNSYTYNGGDLSGFIDITSGPGATNSTATATYSYDNKTSYLPINYIVPGVYFYTPNNVTKINISTTGSSVYQLTYTYLWTYNPNNQPSACTSTIATNPTSLDNGVVISSSYYYQ